MLPSPGPSVYSEHGMPSPPRREAREKELKEAYGQLGDANEVRPACLPNLPV